MAGHSKWANIKHRKAAQDARRGKIFTKIIRELTYEGYGPEWEEDRPVEAVLSAGAETILKLIDMLEDLDDVQNVYHNADISGEIMESL